MFYKGFNNQLSTRKKKLVVVVKRYQYALIRRVYTVVWNGVYPCTQ
jgi:hypothetical protein